MTITLTTILQNNLPIGYSGSKGDGGGYFGSTGYTGSASTAPGLLGYTGSVGADGTSVRIVGSIGSSSGLNLSYGGAIGDGYLANDTGHLWVWDGTIWNDVGGIKGDAGYWGSVGYAGSRGYGGSAGYWGSAGLGYSGSVGGFETPQAIITTAAVTYAIGTSDGGKLIRFDTALGVTVTIPTQSSAPIAIGSRIDILQANTGFVSVVGASGVTIYTDVAPILTTQYTAATIIKIASDTWEYVGAGANGYTGSASTQTGYTGSTVPGYWGSVGGFGSVQAFNTQTGTTYTLVTGDAGKLISVNTPAAFTLLVPTNANASFPPGTHIDIIQANVGTVTIVPTTSTISISNPSGLVLGLSYQYDGGTLINQAPDTWYFYGPAPVGYTGSSGYAGSKGDAGGYTGSKGDVGAPGGAAAIGFSGSKGDAGGYTGSVGYTGSIGSINDATDVDTISLTPTVGQALVWDGTNWVPGSAGETMSPFLLMGA
jgi:hypothetical protein